MRRRHVIRAAAVALCALAVGAGSAQADFRDGAFADTAANGRLDLGPLYIFRSPASASNTVFILTVSPFTDVLTPSTFVKGARYDIAIDRTGDYVPDMVLRTTFGPPSPADGSQLFLVRCLPKPRCRRYVLARGRTATNVPMPGGGTVRAANQDIPMFFDQAGWDSHAATGAVAFPRTVGNAKDFYGPNANSLAIVFEIPSTRIGAPGAIIAAWSRTIDGSGRHDRQGMPFTGTGLLPKLPRNSPATDVRDAFNVGLPENDLSAFTAPMKSVLTGSFYNRNPTDAAFLASAWLPNVSFFQLGNPGGFGTLVGGAGTPFTGPFAGGQVIGNGRQMRDDVVDITLNLMTNGAIPTDNVGDDNGLRSTDGSIDPVSMTQRSIAFPYIAPPSATPAGPNP